jgi:hypothetical protein
MRVQTLLPLLALSLAACERPDGSLDDQLEALTLDATGPDGEPLWEATTLTGAVAVAGAAGDPTLTITTDAGDTILALHLPGASDLSGLDGQDLTVVVPGGEGWSYFGQDALSLSDAAGPVFAAQLVGHAPDASDALFGDGFARYGDKVGYDEKGSRAFHMRTAVFQTDDGPVEALPGEVHTIAVGGATYRLVVIASYETDEMSDAWDASKCLGPPSALSFELLRVEGADAGETLISRDASSEPAMGPGCGV